MYVKFVCICNISIVRSRYADPSDICGQCSGHGVTNERASLTVTVPPGCADGKQFNFQRAADEIPGMETGDVLVLVTS